MSRQQQKVKRTPEAHVHSFTSFPSDARFEHCACGVTRRADRISVNPCVQMFGRHEPAGETCVTCAHLVAHTLHYATWFECELRPGHSARQAQQVVWEACARWKVIGQ